MPMVLQLYNPGPSTVETASIRIFWPSLFEDGGDLFMLKNAPKVIEGQGKCSIASGTDHLQVRYLQLFSQPEGYNPQRHSTEIVIEIKQLYPDRMASNPFIPSNSRYMVHPLRDDFFIENEVLD